MKYFSLIGFCLLLGMSTAGAGALHDAVRDGDVGRTKQLLDQGADVEELDQAGEPALVIASLAGHEEEVALLLERGANIQIRNKNGLTALHAAAYGGHLEIVELLVAKGASVNDSENFYKMTPLHAASEEGHADTVGFLLANKAEVEAKERNGYTPLTQAGWREHWDSASLLMKAGAVCQTADLVGDWLFKECNKRK